MNPVTATHETYVRQLNSLLRGEISAAETYGIAIQRVGDDHAEEVSQLREIAREHSEQARDLRLQIERLGGSPDQTSGAWGRYAKAVEAVATLFGDASALRALKEGEEHGLRDYERALSEVDPVSRQLIEQVFIPGQRRHVALLDGMIARL